MIKDRLKGVAARVSEAAHDAAKKISEVADATATTIGDAVDTVQAEATRFADEVKIEYAKAAPKATKEVFVVYATKETGFTQRERFGLVGFMSMSAAELVAGDAQEIFDKAMHVDNSSAERQEYVERLTKMFPAADVDFASLMNHINWEVRREPDSAKNVFIVAPVELR